jgi:hypothetical protein
MLEVEVVELLELVVLVFLMVQFKLVVMVGQQ